MAGAACQSGKSCEAERELPAANIDVITSAEDYLNIKVNILLSKDSCRKRTDVPSCGYTFLDIHVIIFDDL